MSTCDWSIHLEGEREEPIRELTPREYQWFCAVCLPLDLRLDLACSFLPPEKSEEEHSSVKPKPR
jgi:hypothetical protein